MIILGSLAPAVIDLFSSANLSSPIIIEAEILIRNLGPNALVAFEIVSFLNLSTVVSSVDNADLS